MDARLRDRAAPVILGHEFSGEVVEVGSGVTGVAVGDRIWASYGAPAAIDPTLMVRAR